MFCPKCGTKNEEKAKFCKKCGENLKNFTNSVITSEKKDENSKTVFGRKKLDYNKLAIILVIGIAVVILIGVIITYVDAHPDVGTYQRSVVIWNIEIDSCLNNQQVVPVYGYCIDQLNSVINDMQGVTPPTGYGNLHNDLFTETQCLKEFFQLRQDGVQTRNASEISLANNYYAKAMVARNATNTEISEKGGPWSVN